MNKTPSKPTEICPTCGTRVSEGATRCLVCGTELSSTDDKSSSVSKAVQGSRMPQVTLSLPAALGLLAVFLFIGAAVVYAAVRQEPTIAVPATPTVTSTITPSPTLTPTPTTPAPTETPQPTPTPLTYSVVEGDTCLKIAFAFDVSVQSIVLQNNLPATCDTLFVGQALLIPHPTPTPTAFPTATLSPAEATRQACETISYTVQDNDTLSTIALNYNVSSDAIKSWNGMVSDTVFSGMQIIIPLCERVYLGPTLTPTIPPPYSAPNLLLPPDGAPFTGTDEVITLQWASVGTLREGEFYVVTIEDITEGEGRKLVDYVTDTKFNVPVTFRPDSDLPHIIRWWVGTARQSGTDEEGRPVYVPAGATSSPRDFTWIGKGGGGTQTP